MLNRSTTMVLVSFLVVAALAAASGCTSANDNSGGQSGTQGQTSEESSTLRVELVEQWLESGHSKIVTFAAEEDGCKNCHDGATYVTTGGGFVGRISATATAEASGTPERDWVVATDCRVCHTGAGVEFAAKGTIDIPGQEVKAGVGALCISCHNGWHGPGASQAGGQRAPHGSIQGDMVFMSNVATVGTAPLDLRNPHQKVQDVCVGCHVTGLAVPGQEASSSGAPPSHTFKVASTKSCMGKDCHAKDPLTTAVKEDLDGDGQKEPYQTEVEGMLQSLKSAIESRAGGTFESSGGEIKFAKGATPDEAAYAAAYNYLYVVDDRSRGAHSPIFTVSLLKQTTGSLGTP